MATKTTIINILYYGFMDYVPLDKLIDYQNECESRKTHSTKFALTFFPKYIDFEKAIKNPLQPYDILLLNYWIIEVPNIGIRGSKLLWEYHYDKNRLVNQRVKADINKTKSRTKLLLTKRQRQEAREKKLKTTRIRYYPLLVENKLA